jgi:hypothetical protein
MKDLSEYNLIYHEIETGKAYRARRVESGKFKFYDTDLGLTLDMPLSRVKKYFKGDVSNRRNQIDNFRKCKSIFYYE